MQILEIVIFSKEGEKRVIPLSPNKINIIIGIQRTGKSVLGNIVEYVLGQDQCNVAEGVIRDTVSWFGVKLQFHDGQAFIARENPGYGIQSTNRAFLEYGDIIESPERKPEKPNTTNDGIVEFLSNKIGISANKTEPQPHQTRVPFSANIKHTFFYCFQEQDEIATNKFLFHHQSESWARDAIKDTLPFFLGVVKEDRLNLSNEFTNVKREIKKAKKEYETAELIKLRIQSQVAELLSEACEVGLINIIEPNKTDEEVIKILRGIISWKPTANYCEIANDDRLDSLHEKVSILKKKIALLSQEIADAEIFAQEFSGYETEVKEQFLRLQSISLYDRSGFKADTCPLCSSTLKNPSPNVQKITTSLKNLNSRLESTNRERPKLHKFIQRSEEEKRRLHEDLEIAIKEINGIYKEKDSENKIGDLNIRRGIVIGRVKSYLDSIKFVDENAEIKETISHLEIKQKRLESELDTQNLEDLLQIALNTISYDMTTYARVLELEHSNNHIMFDFKHVTVVAERKDKPISLQQMGSATNFLGYHLITLLSFHKFFCERNRPVPSFLFLDQISQISFGNNPKTKQLTKEIFKFIFNVENELSNKFQIILTEQADFDDDWYRDAIVNRLDEGLIPQDWINKIPNE